MDPGQVWEYPARMQQVDHYRRQAVAARKLAMSARSEKSRGQFTQIAEAWEKLTRERLRFLRLKESDDLGGDALMDTAPIQIAEMLRA